MKTTKNKRFSEARLASLLAFFVLLATASFGCGDKSADTKAAPYSNAKNPAAVPAAPVTANPIGARGGPPEAEAYRQKMGTSAKAPGQR